MKFFTSEPEIPATADVTIDGRRVVLSLRRSERARRYTLRLTPTGDLVVTIPRGGGAGRALAFVRAHEGWIRARLDRLVSPVAFAPGVVIPFRGAPHQLRHAGRRRGLVSVRAGEGGALPSIEVAGGEEHFARRLTDWLKGRARADLEAAAATHARAAGVTIRRLSVRDQTSRWGSCSTGGALSFSWRLVLAPPMVLDYLAAHEVAHLVEMNHGPAFWRLTRRLAPHTDEAESWLKRHGRGLHRYGAS